MDPCNEIGGVRLTHFNEDPLGRLEVCYDGYWGSVCDDGATSVTAAVACRLLGHRDVAEGQAGDVYIFLWA